MKKALLFLLLLNFCLFMNAQPAGKTIPVTTSSKKALAFYNEAMNASQDVDLTKYNQLINKAIAEDPDFFMAYYQQAMFAAYLNQEKNFIKFATAAAGSKSKISEGEKILKDAVRLLLENRNADVTGFGKRLIEKYPEDINSYLQLMTYQYLIKDLDGQIATLNDALKLPGRKDYLYNALAYAHMEKGQFKEAEAALDKYIALSPQLPNPWDSKGDLYMRTKEYVKAYENYMKANSIDTAWSKGKALKAKTLAEKSSGNQPSQAEFMKKFYGTWHSGNGRDTVYIFEMDEYNNAAFQISSSIIGGVKKVQFACSYIWDPQSASYKGFTLFPGGQTQTWRVRSGSENTMDFEMVKDLTTNYVLQRRTVIFTDPDHMIVNIFNQDNVQIGSSKLVRTSLPITNRATDLIGTYEYYGNQKGMSVWNENHFVWALENKSSISDPEITPENRMKSLNVAGGTWTMQDSIVTCTYQYHINPKMVGTSFRFVYTINGNIINSRFINKEGNVIGRSSAIKIKCSTK